MEPAPDWINSKERLPDENIVVEAMMWYPKDGGGRVYELIWANNLWWFSDGSMYVYFFPTHWRYQ